MKTSYLSLFLFCFIFFSNKAYSNQDIKKNILEHLISLKFFSASFLQSDGQNISEGRFYIGENRLRAEYVSPSKILIVLDKNKAMYYNYELDEDEFFNPKDTSAWFLYDIFKNPFFFEDGIIELKDNELIIKKNGLDNQQREFLIKVYFENNPLILRKVEVLLDQDYFQLSIYNHNYNQEFNKKFFKLINPSFLN